MDQEATEALPCDPRHRLCFTCAQDNRTTHCPLCRHPLRPEPDQRPSPMNPTSPVNVHILVRHRRLLEYREVHDLHVSPPHYNVWGLLPDYETWEAYIRDDRPGFHRARNRLHRFTKTTDPIYKGLQLMALLRQLETMNGDLLLEYDIQDSWNPVHYSHETQPPPRVALGHTPPRGAPSLSPDTTAPRATVDSTAYRRRGRGRKSGTARPFIEPSPAGHTVDT